MNCSIGSSTSARIGFWSLTSAILVFGLLFCLLFLGTGCTTANPGSRWYAPSTWSLFSGSRQIAAAAQAETKVDAAKTALAATEREAVHTAHVEIRKGQIAAATLPPSPAADYTQRTLGNGLGLLNQFDPLTGAEESDALALVRDILSSDAAKVAAAEHKQLAAERIALDLSQELGAANARIAELEGLSRKANASERAAHEENLALANELRASRWRFWIAVALVLLVGAFALYARCALGGVGAALHAAGAPTSVIAALDGELSKFGQWMIRTGRLAAAKVQAVAAAQS